MGLRMKSFNIIEKIQFLGAGGGGRFMRPECILLFEDIS